jgi:hypothetical protein
MKVQLQGQTLRFRIDEAELAVLQAGGVVENRTCLPGACLTQSVVLTDSPAPTLERGVRLQLPRSLLDTYVARLPCRDGLTIRLPLPADQESLEIVFEVDVRDSVRTRGPRKAAGAH